MWIIGPVHLGRTGSVHESGHMVSIAMRGYHGDGFFRRTSGFGYSSTPVNIAEVTRQTALSA